jgi:hypothetical protein
MDDNDLTTDQLIGLARTIGHFLADCDDADQTVHDVKELVDIVASKDISLADVIDNGLRCQLRGGYIEQDAAATTANWREVVERLLGNDDMPPAWKIIIRHCACRDELSGLELYELEQIADCYDR